MEDLEDIYDINENINDESFKSTSPPKKVQFDEKTMQDEKRKSQLGGSITGSKLNNYSNDGLSLEDLKRKITTCYNAGKTDERDKALLAFC